jgi:hypothetical protein
MCLSHKHFPLITCFSFHDTNSFYCVTVNFSVENYEYSNMLLSGSDVPLGGAALNKIQVLLREVLYLKQSDVRSSRTS